jgi:hypothetical protein
VSSPGSIVYGDWRAGKRYSKFKPKESTKQPAQADADDGLEPF